MWRRKHGGRVCRRDEGEGSLCGCGRSLAAAASNVIRSKQTRARPGSAALGCEALVGAPEPAPLEFEASVSPEGVGTCCERVADLSVPWTRVCTRPGGPEPSQKPFQQTWVRHQGAIRTRNAQIAGLRICLYFSERDASYSRLCAAIAVGHRSSASRFSFALTGSAGMFFAELGRTLSSSAANAPPAVARLSQC